MIQSDLSAIVTLASSGIDTPRKLDGKTYASYGARYTAPQKNTFFQRHAAEFNCWLDYLTPYSLLSSTAELAFFGQKWPRVHFVMFIAASPCFLSTLEQAEGSCRHSGSYCVNIIIRHSEHL